MRDAADSRSCVSKSTASGRPASKRRPQRTAHRCPCLGLSGTAGTKPLPARALAAWLPADPAPPVIKTRMTKLQRMTRELHFQERARIGSWPFSASTAYPTSVSSGGARLVSLPAEGEGERRRPDHRAYVRDWTYMLNTAETPRRMFRPRQPAHGAARATDRTIPRE